LQARSVSRIYDLLSLQQNGNLQIREFENCGLLRGALIGFCNQQSKI
jgi:hypothetical protein